MGASAASATAASYAAWENQKVEPWQEATPSGYLRCLACNKMCDGVHEHTAEHLRRVEDYMWSLEAEGRDYPAPVQAWLAWVSDPSSGDRRYLKCLLCKKWVQDFDSEGMNTAGYAGNHGEAGPSNQKDHAKKLNNLQYYLDELKTEKQKWHAPEPTVRVAKAAEAASAERVKPTPAPWATRAIAEAAPADVRLPATSLATGSRPVPAAPPGEPPSGAASPAGSGRAAGRWGAPGAAVPRAVAAAAVAAEPAAPPVASPPPKPALPIGWDCKWDEHEGEYYYFNTATRKTQWEHPSETVTEVLEEC